MRAHTILALFAATLLVSNVNAASIHSNEHANNHQVAAPGTNQTTPEAPAAFNSTTPVTPPGHGPGVKKAHKDNKQKQNAKQDAKLAAAVQTIQADLAKLKNITTIAAKNHGQLIALQNHLAKLQQTVAKVAKSLNIDQVATALNGTVHGVKGGVADIAHGVNGTVHGVKGGVEGTLEVVKVDVEALIATIVADVEKILAAVTSEVAKVNIAGHLAPLVNAIEKILKDAKIIN